MESRFFIWTTEQLVGAAVSRLDSNSACGLLGTSLFRGFLDTSLAAHGLPNTSFLLYPP